MKPGAGVIPTCVEPRTGVLIVSEVLVQGAYPSE